MRQQPKPEDIAAELLIVNTETELNLPVCGPVVT